MKRLFAIFLAVLMLIPFSAFAVSAEGETEKVEIPAEPVKADNGIVVYVSYRDTSGVMSSDSNAGNSAENLLGTWGKGVFYMIGDTGGTVCIPGKGYIGTNNYPFKKCPNTVTITAYDPQLNQRYNGTLEVDNGDGTFSNGTQKGMFMILSSYTLIIEGDYIFENIDIIERIEAAGQTVGTSVMSVANGGKLVIEEDVKVMKMTPCEESVIMNVDAGGYLYLKTSGFEKYTGDGVIVMEEALYNSDKFDGSMFLEFNGAVVTPDGKILLGTMPETPDEPTLETGGLEDDEPLDTKKPTANDTSKATAKATEKADVTTNTTTEQTAEFPLVPLIVGVVAAVIVVAVVIIVITKKKKTE